MLEVTLTPKAALTTPITPKILAKAFEAWELGFRAAPQSFRTTEEIAQLGVSQVTAERADYFFALLQHITKG